MEELMAGLLERSWDRKYSVQKPRDLHPNLFQYGSQGESSLGGRGGVRGGLSVSS